MIILLSDLLFTLDKFVITQPLLQSKYNEIIISIRLNILTNTLHMTYSTPLAQDEVPFIKVSLQLSVDDSTLYSKMRTD